MTDLRTVKVGPCRCPGTPHPDGDTVSLDTQLSTPAGIAAQAALMEGSSWEERYAGMVMGLMRFSVRDWTLRDENGAIPITAANVDQHLPWLRGGKEVAAAITELHQASILDPFVEAFNRQQSAKKTPTTDSSLDGSTDSSLTSPTPISPRKRPKG
jgi:hypothetical protein